MHQLHRESLHDVVDVDRFFSHYLGDPVMQKLERTPLRYSMWPQQARETLNALCIHYAEAMPEADHVIRADVGARGLTPPDVAGEFLMYFGFQTGQRAHYTCVAHARTAVKHWAARIGYRIAMYSEEPAAAIEEKTMSACKWSVCGGALIKRLGLMQRTVEGYSGPNFNTD